MRTSSTKVQPLPPGDAFGNVSAVGGAYGVAGVILSSALPQKLYFSASEWAAGTDPFISIKDPEIGVLRAKVRELEKQLADKVGDLANQVAQLRQDLESRPSVQTVALSSLASTQYRLRQPLWVELDASGDGVTAHIPELEEFGAGVTEYEALEDLRSVIVETYAFLLENESNLGPAPASQLRRFRDLLETL